MTKGTSFTEITEWIEGYFSCVEDARIYLRETGYIGDEFNEETTQEFIREHLPTSTNLPNTTDTERLLLDRERRASERKADEVAARAMQVKLHLNRRRRSSVSTKSFRENEQLEPLAAHRLEAVIQAAGQESAREELRRLYPDMSDEEMEGFLALA
jgi:phage gp29-like protein